MISPMASPLSPSETCAAEALFDMADSDTDDKSLADTITQDPKDVFLTERKKRRPDEMQALENQFGEIEVGTSTKQHYDINDTKADVNQTLAFPVAINIEDIANDPASGSSCMSSINPQSLQSASASSAIERNKNLCAAVASGRSNLLTAEEEERISEMLQQDEDVEEKYGRVPSVEADDDREVELDSILYGLGYNVNTEDQEEDENEKSTMRGDPVLRQLAEQRIRDEHEQRIDTALRTLQREPLPPVISVQDGDDGPSTCNDTVLSMPLTEEDIQEMIQRVKQELEEDGLELADHNTIRSLAQSIIDEESTKKSVRSLALS